jgi:hypothetical protein
VTNNEIVSGIDLSKFNFRDLGNILRTSGLPQHIDDKVLQLYTMFERGFKFEPVEGADLSKKWTVPVSPETIGMVETIIGRKL